MLRLCVCVCVSVRMCEFCLPADGRVWWREESLSTLSLAPGRCILEPRLGGDPVYMSM